MRIVSICPSSTEMLAYLGLTASLVGVDNYSDWPQAVHKLPRLGSDLNIDMDAVPGFGSGVPFFCHISF